MGIIIFSIHTRETLVGHLVQPVSCKISPGVSSSSQKGERARDDFFKGTLVIIYLEWSVP